MKKYLLTLSSLALSLGMTHAAEDALVVAGDDAVTAASGVFGGGSVVDSSNPFAAMTIETEAADMVREDTAAGDALEEKAPGAASDQASDDEEGSASDTAAPAETGSATDTVNA